MIRVVSLNSLYIKNSEKDFYSDFAVYRHQNFRGRWRRCRVIKDNGEGTIAVEFPNEEYPELTELYMVPNYEVISMH